MSLNRHVLVNYVCFVQKSSRLYPAILACYTNFSYAQFTFRSNFPDRNSSNCHFTIPPQFYHFVNFDLMALFLIHSRSHFIHFNFNLATLNEFDYLSANLIMIFVFTTLLPGFFHHQLTIKYTNYFTTYNLVYLDF